MSMLVLELLLLLGGEHDASGGALRRLTQILYRVSAKSSVLE